MASDYTPETTAYAGTAWDLGTEVYDHRSHRTGVVVAGAQNAGLVTVAFPEHTWPRYASHYLDHSEPAVTVSMRNGDIEVLPAWTV